MLALSRVCAITVTISGYSYDTDELAEVWTTINLVLSARAPVRIQIS